MRKIRLLSKLFVFLFFAEALAVLGAEEVLNDAEGWGFNIPETWVLAEAGSDGRSFFFNDSRGQAFFQAFSWPAEEAEAPDIAQRIKKQLGAREAEGGREDFDYNGQKASLLDLEWNMGKNPMRGYVLALDGGKRDLSFLAFSVRKDWEGYHDFLLSVLDSVYAGSESALLPGPLSQLVAGDGWFGGPVKDKEAAVDAAQVVTEREARVLAQYQKADSETQIRAWRRFYQMVWRDNYQRLAETASYFQQAFVNKKVPQTEIPVKLLSWLQSFEYEELNTLSDLRAPYSAILTNKGDCDSRSLVYMILLEHLGYPSVLMVSPIHKHSLVGVGIPGEGARFPFEGKTWLVAETTVLVPIGRIEQKMSDPKDWIGMDLHNNP